MARCDECLWSGQCRMSGHCPDFSPVEDDTDKIVEKRRKEFEREWAKYIKVMDE